MTYKVELRPKALKFLKSIPKIDQERIKEKLIEISKKPRCESVIKLSGIEPAQYRARQGDYRIFFAIEDKVLLVEVIDIRNRQKAYKNK